MNDNQITIKRPRWKNGQLYLSAVTMDSTGTVTPIFYQDFLERAGSCGWKRLSQKTTDTEQTEVWELKREQDQDKGDR